MTSAEQSAERNPNNARAPKHTITIRPMTGEDYPAVRKILQDGLDTGEATFESEAPDWKTFQQKRIMDLAFVAVDNDNQDILGWIAASPMSHREVFHGVVEDSIYMSTAAAGRGVGGMLLDHLITAAGEYGMWKIHSSIFPENEGSVKLHESRGFTQAGHFHSMARMSYGPKEGQWRDIIIMELVLDNGPAAPAPSA